MLTKAEAIRNHRLMWNWIAQTSIQEQRCVIKDEAIEYFGWPEIKTECWCCQYSRVEQNSLCEKCPIVWTNSSTILASCCEKDTEFTNWSIAIKKQNYILAAKYAYRIADLPERRSM